MKSYHNLSVRNLLILMFIGLIIVVAVVELNLRNVILSQVSSRHFGKVHEGDFATIVQHLTDCKSRNLITASVQYGGNYWLLKNLYRGSISESAKCAETITLTTHGDYTFMDNLEPLLLRWKAPISFAMFAPGTDMSPTLFSIQYARNCLPASDLIRKYVTFHLYFPLSHFPEQIPRNEMEALGSPYNCSEIAPYANVQVASMYKTIQNLTYPINVGRNIARKEANTHFIFPSDIELYTSPKVVEQFLKMIAKNPHLVSKERSFKIFPLPIFEVDAQAQVPQNKTELVEMVNKKLIIPFHSYICRTCHLIPNHTDWYALADSSDMSVFTVAKRQKAFQHWEPIFISDNREPFYDERLTWEGENDKKVQGYALCQLDYEFHILHPAFLVHRPGIKRTRYHNKAAISTTTNLLRTFIKPQYKILYGNNSQCQF